MNVRARLGVLLLLLSVALAGPAFARGQRKDSTALDPISDAANRFVLSVPKGLRPSPPHIRSEALHVFSGPRGLTASVTRFDSANRAAFQRGKSKAFAAQVQRGLAKTVKGFDLRSARFERVDRVPVLDVEFLRTSPDGTAERVWMRFLFRFRFTVVATASIPSKASRSSRRVAKVFTRSLRPLSIR